MITHTWYGSQPDKPPIPHKGVTVYEKIADSFTPPSTLSDPLMGLALVGLGYLLWRQG